MSFGWSEGAVRFRDLTTGRFVPTSQVNNAVEAVIRAAGERMVGFSQALQEGRMSVSQWQAAMVAELKPLHVGAAAMGRGGWAQMGQSEYGWTGSALKKQYAFLRNFAHDIATGKQPMDGRLLQRTRMYASAAAGTQREMARRTGAAIGRTEERNVLGATDRHCSQCVGCTAQGWVPIGSLPAIGSRTCVSQCRCVIQTRVIPQMSRAA